MSTFHTTTAKYQGNYRISTLLSWRACVVAHSKIPGFIYLCRLFALFVITCSVVSFCCSFLLGLSNILTFSTPSARCYIFFSHKRNTLPPGNRFRHTHTHTPKNRLRKTILEFLLHTRHTLPIVVAIFGLFFSHLFLFFLALFLPPFFPSRFFNYEKKKLLYLSHLFSSRVCSSP